MRIKRLAYENKRTGWKLAPMEFGNFNLLVGVSGVGKSKILEAIRTLYWTASNVGRTWEVDFSIDNTDYHWSYLGGWPFIFNADKNSPNNFLNIEKEVLTGNGFVFERNVAAVKIDGHLLPVDHNPAMSLLQLFSSDKRIKPIFEGVKKIRFLSMPESVTPQEFKPDNVEAIIKEHTSLEIIQNSDYFIHTKLVMVGLNLPDIFQQIKENFIAVFPQVQDLRIVYLKKERFGLNGTASQNFSTFEIELQESGIDTWIDQDDISTGMLKTLLLIGAIYLSAPGSVILIDEFENSLGVNCIDIFDRLDYENRGLQFIITSHHPYIINNIPVACWKIITRKGSVVTAHDADHYNLGKSKHTAFTQLLQLKEFEDGLTRDL